MAEAVCFIEFWPGMRRLIEDAIESLLLLLDEIDGDDELEGGNDAEPDTDGEGDDPPEHDVGDLPAPCAAPKTVVHRPPRAPPCIRIARSMMKTVDVRRGACRTKSTILA